METWEKFWIAIFWISLPVSGFFLWRLFSMERKERKLKKQIQRDLHLPGMEDVRKFLKPQFRKHGIDVDDKHFEKN